MKQYLSILLLMGVGSNLLGCGDSFWADQDFYNKWAYFFSNYYSKARSSSRSNDRTQSQDKLELPEDLKTLEAMKHEAETIKDTIQNKIKEVTSKENK